ncbi:hypothetical protein P0D84_41185 [Paraburkholderia sp. RL17-337-BIB-A]
MTPLYYVREVLARLPAAWGGRGGRSAAPGITVEIACLNTIWNPAKDSSMTMRLSKLAT